MGLLSKAQQIALVVLLAVLAAAIAFGGWNWWRKNVYYDALQNVAASRAAAIADAQATLDKRLNAQALDLMTRSNDRARTLQDQIDEIASRPPSERVVYQLRDRWLPVTCPDGSAAGAQEAQVGGLQREDELFLVRFAAAANDATDERNSCISMYETAREQALKANK